MHLSVFNPASPEASHLLSLWDDCMYICTFILAVVTISIAYILFRYRKRGDGEPNQTTGNRKLEIAWTAIPIALVALLFVLSVLTAEAVDHPAKPVPDIVITGHQWWWEVRYPSGNAITANEVHVPVGQDMLIDVESADVIHDFWVPRLGRKIDAVPGWHNHIWIHADHAGEYNGACAEYCGPQHAWMRFRVIAEDPATFQQWLAHQAEPAQAPTAADAKTGESRFGELTCVNCHNIQGLHSQKQYAPDLTHLASRRMLAAERLQNTPANLRDWLRQPNILKPNCYMPNVNLSNEDLTCLTAFLETLK